MHFEALFGDIATSFLLLDTCGLGLRQCWCGDPSTDLVKHGESTACNYKCPGNPDEIYGGFQAMSVYEFYYCC